MQQSNVIGTNARPLNSNKIKVIGAVLSLVLLGFVILLYLDVYSPYTIPGVVHYQALSRTHDNTVSITNGDLPPPGGAHFDRWQNCGIYTEPIETGYAIHSMEHGAVWITYQPDLPEDDIVYLQTLVRGEDYLLLSPYPGLRSPVVLTAWGVQLELDSMRDDRVTRFIAHYRQGPTAPELGASCTGGVGQPHP
ncbi:MAG TPA: DUF3105 domain-containing protein [Candidatus Sulfomarinibacteraceae bacterium]|nr:DUF3105 domain-containing protein [Candidatus Sulfomarinibacteraceae bacterium]